MATRFTWQLNMARGKTSTVEATAADALLKVRGEGGRAGEEGTEEGHARREGTVKRIMR